MLRSALLAVTVLASCANEGTSPNDTDPLRCDDDGDPFTVNSVDIDGPYLRASVSVSGGCASHTLTLVWPGWVAASSPPEAWIKLHHHGHGDACEAWLTQDLYFDLGPLDQTLQEGGGGSVNLSVGDKFFVLSSGQTGTPHEGAQLLQECAAD